MAPFGVQKFRRMVFVGSFAVITEFLMGFLGSILSGNLLGESAMAGVSLLSPVMTAVIFVSGLFGVGTGVNYALALGRCERRRAHEIFTQGVWSALGAGVVMALLIRFGLDAFIGFFDPSPEVAAYARDYGRWFVPVALFEPVAGLLVNCCYADGDSRQCLTAYVAQLVVNVGVSYAAIRSGWGTAGCALGAAVGFAVAATVLALHFLKPSNSFRLVRHFDLRDTLLVMKSSFGDASGTLCDALLFFALSKYFLAHYGSAELPVLGAVITVLGLLEIANGVGVAAQPIVSVYVGERNAVGARRVMRAALAVSVAEGVAFSLLLAVWPQGVVAFVGISDPALASAACRALRLVAPGLVLTTVANLLNGYYILVGHEGLAVGLSFWKWLVAPLALVFAFGSAGPVGVWWALGLAPFVAMGAFGALLLARYGRDAFPWLLDRARDAAVRIYDLALDEPSIVATSVQVAAALQRAGVAPGTVVRARLMTEEVLMAVRDRNAPRRVLAEATLDLNDGAVLTLRDDGEIFDITDVDQRVLSLRTFLVASVMERQQAKVNLITTGFNRNVFRF